MATNNERVLGSMPVSAPLLESANWWFSVSWYGLLIAGAITAVGAFGTVVFLFVQFWSSGVREAHLEWRTSEVELEAKKVSVAIEQAKADVVTANERIAVANQEIAKSHERTATLERETAAAVLSLEREKVARAEFEAQFSWRILSDQEKERIKSVLSGTSHVVAIEFPSGDQEAAFLAHQFAKSLSDAGWKSTLRSVPSPPMLFWGVAVAAPESVTTNLLRDALTPPGMPPRELMETPVPGMFMGDLGGPAPECRLVIGSKLTEAIMRTVNEMNARNSAK